MQRLHSLARLVKELRKVSVIDEYSRFGSRGPGFQHLQPISLSAMKINTVYQSKFLSGTLAVQPFNIAGVTATVFQSGSESVHLFVNNALTGDDEFEAEKLFPQGARVVVKEPVYLLDYPFQGSGPCLWLSNPTSLEVISYTNSDEHRPEDCAIRAAEEASKEHHGAAIELYTRYVQHQVDGSNWFSHVKVTKGDCNDVLNVVDGLVGRSESWLKLRRFHNALNDVEQALKLDSSNVRSVACKVKALWGLQRYTDAYSFVEQCGSPDAASVRERALSLKNASTVGSHDLAEFSMQKSQPDEAAEYVGPVEIQMTSDGRGRGLFLTADVRCGQLLFVTNAIAELRFDPGDLQSAEDLLNLRRKLFVKVLRACSSSTRARSQVYSMMELHTESEDGQCIEKAVPSMQIFMPNVEIEEESSWDVDVPRIWRIVQGDDYGSDFWGSSYIGLWPLITFLNNSCCFANVSTLKVGGAWYVYASRDMQSGSELFRSYLPSGGFESHAKRRQQLPFSCNCPRCILEQKLEEQLKPLEELDDTVRSGAAAVHLERLLNTCPVLRELSCRDKQWLRASYFESYFWYYGAVRFFPSRSQNFPWMPSMEKFLNSCHETKPGSVHVLKLILRWMKAQNEGAVKKTNADLEELLHKELVAGYGLQNAKSFEAITRN